MKFAQWFFSKAICYTTDMANTEIEERIEAAEKVVKAWRLPKTETPVSKQTWDKILDSREASRGGWNH